MIIIMLDLHMLRVAQTFQQDRTLSKLSVSFDHLLCRHIPIDSFHWKKRSIAFVVEEWSETIIERNECAGRLMHNADSMQKSCKENKLIMVKFESAPQLKLLVACFACTGWLNYTQCLPTFPGIGKDSHKNSGESVKHKAAVLDKPGHSASGFTGAASKA